MAGPPDTMTASELWTALLATPRPHRVVDFPRNDPMTGKPVGQLAIWVLTHEEQMVATAAADRFAKRVLKDAPKKDDVNLGYETMFHNAVSIEVLFRACREPKNLTYAAFPSPEDMRKTLSTDEVGTLVSAYVQVQSEIGPIVSMMSEGEMDAWLTRIEEGGDAISPFFLLSPEMKNDLLRYSARALSTSRTGRSSSGSPPDDPPADEQASE